MGAVIEKYPTWSISDRQNKLTASLFNGGVSFAVYPRDRNAGRDAIVRISLDKDGGGLVGLLDIIDQIGKAPLGQKVPMSRTQFDPATKTRKNLWVITIGKDNDMVYSITLTDCTTQKTVSMPIIASQSITIGNDPPSKSSLSALGMKLFKRWLIRAENNAPLTVDPDRQFGNRGGNGGGRSGGQSGGYAGGGQPHIPSAPAVSPSMDADETMPF